MDTERFELTGEEIKKAIAMGEDVDNYKGAVTDGDRGICQAQVAKVLSLLEPVELEALGDEEMAEAQENKEACLTVIRAFGTCKGCSANCRAISRATCQKNQAKGQLFRVKEG